MEDINKIFSKLNFTKGRRYFAFGSSPEADWRIILLSFILLCFITIGLCTYFFYKINLSDINPESSPTVTAPAFNINKLRQTISHYKEKEMEFERVRSTPETVVDPSL